MSTNNSPLMGKIRVCAVAKHLSGKGEVEFILLQGGKGCGIPSGPVWKHTGSSSKKSKAFSATAPEASPSPGSQAKGSPCPAWTDSASSSAENAPMSQALQVNAQQLWAQRKDYFVILPDCLKLQEALKYVKWCFDSMSFSHKHGPKAASLPTMPRLSRSFSLSTNTGPIRKEMKTSAHQLPGSATSKLSVSTPCCPLHLKI